MPGFGSGVAGFAAGFPGGYEAGYGAELDLQKKQKDALALAAYGSMLQNLPGAGSDVPPPSPASVQQPAPFSQPQQPFSQPQQPSPYQGLSSNAYASADDYGTTLPQPQRPMGNLSDQPMTGADLSARPATFDQRFVFDPAAPVHTPQDLALARPAPRPAPYTGQPMYDPWSRPTAQPMPQPQRVASAAPGGGIFGGINQPQPGGGPSQLPPPMQPPRPGPGGMAAGGAPGPAGSTGPGASPFGFGGQGLTTQQVVQAALRSNPNMPPDILGRVVQLAQPQMEAQERMLAERLRLQLQAQGQEETKRFHDIEAGHYKALEEQAKTRTQATLSEDAIDSMADQYNSGFSRVLAGQTPGNRVAVQNRASEKALQEGWTPADLLRNQQKFASNMQRARTVGTMEARVGEANEIVKSVIPQAIAASEKVPRGSFVPWNSLMQRGLTAISDPNMRSFAVVNRDLAAAVGRAMAPYGVGRRAEVEDALALLKTTDSHETYIQVLKQIEQMVNRAVEATKRGEDGFNNTGRASDETATSRSLFPDSISPSSTTGGAASPAAAPVKVSTPAEARKLPSGTRIILPDGSPGVVP